MAAGLGSLILGSAAQAAVQVEDLKQIVDSCLEENGYNYEYNEDSERYDLIFSLDNNLEKTEVSIFLYDDMVSVTADSPLSFSDDQFENVAVFTTLVNNDIFYGQFRVDKESNRLSCRTCNLIENELPDAAVIDTLLYEAVYYLDYYGDGIAAVCAAEADPYEAYEEIIAGEQE